MAEVGDTYASVSVSGLLSFVLPASLKGLLLLQPSSYPVALWLACGRDGGGLLSAA